MNGFLATRDAPPERVNSLLLPLAGLQLLVPVTAVAEVVAGDYPLEADTREIPGFQGWIHWREQRIPLLCFEHALGRSNPSPVPENRLAVLNAIGDAADIGYFALRLAGYPSPLHVTAETPLEAMTEAPGESDDFLFMMANIDGRDVSVPDLLALERRCIAPLL